MKDDKLFWQDENRAVSYNELLLRVNTADAVPRIIKDNDVLNVFVQIIVGMVYGKSLVLLDGNLSDTELSNMGYDSVDAACELKIKERLVIDSIEAMVGCIKRNSWKLKIYTSGTSGLPKSVVHNNESLLRGIKISVKHAYDIWALAYNATHMAGLQVFFQALLNRNSIVNIFGLNPEVASCLLDKNCCTHISATPSFYRNLLPFIKDNNCLEQVTFGGERFDVHLSELLGNKWRKATFHNIYASTEIGTLFVSEGDTFEITPDLQKYIRINESGELLVQRKLLAEFCTHEDEWYNTKDIVTLEGNKIKFIARNIDLVNVGGYKVNLLEIEDFIREDDKILDCLVYARENSVLGNIVVADIVVEGFNDKKEFKKNLLKRFKEKLQKYKMPAVINFVSRIELGRTGKKKRK